MPLPPSKISLVILVPQMFTELRFIPKPYLAHSATKSRVKTGALPRQFWGRFGR